MRPAVPDDVSRQTANEMPETDLSDVRGTPKIGTLSEEHDTGSSSLKTSNATAPDPAISVNLASSTKAPENILGGGESSAAGENANTPGAVAEEGSKNGADVVPKTKKDERDVKSDTEDDKTEDDDSDTEDVSTAARFYKSKTLYKALRNRLATRQGKRTADGAKAVDQGHVLVKSLADYLRVLEERVGKLEKEKEGDKAAVTKPAEAKKDGKPDGVSPDGDEVLTSFHDYRTEEVPIFADKPPRHEGPFSSGEESFINMNPKYVLRVLFGWNGKRDGQPSHDILSQPDPGQIEIFGIRINSEPIAKFFEKEVGSQMDRSSVTYLAKPFRVLIRNAAAIRGQLDSLERKYGSSTPQKASSSSTVNDTRESVDGTATSEVQNSQTGEPETAGTPATKSSAEPAYESKAALVHFRELMAFVNKYIGHKVQLFGEFRAGTPLNVAFEDLWMLFDLGDIVMCHSRRGEETISAGNSDDDAHLSTQRHVAQAYRVISSVGGVPRLKSVFPSPSLADGEEQTERDTRSAMPAVNINGQQILTLFDVPQTRVKAKDRLTPLQVYCHFLDYNGRYLSAVPEIFEIKPFEGEVGVASLHIFPVSYQRVQSGGKSIDFRSRGLQFLEYMRVAHLHYDGLTVGETPEEITSPVMIDFALAFKESPALVPRSFGKDVEFWGSNCSQSSSVYEIAVTGCDEPKSTCCLKDKYCDQEKGRSGTVLSILRSWLEELEVDGERQIEKVKRVLSDSNLAVLLPGVVHGFSLHGRKWLQFDIRYLKKLKVAEGDSGWKELVLPGKHRDMVQSMVQTHTAGSRQSLSRTSGESKYDMGLVQGKGKGCIILLHGVPGVGKTSTAECVAAYTGRPLFPITCGDIGYEPVEVEKNLENLFRLAHKWGCVLLIDEADVFLAERDKADVKRNGLVSVFLRVLEYYSGILFLTTNRVGSFDEAFRSRIHLSLYYPKLTLTQSREVWRMNMRRIDRLNAQRKKDGLRRVAYEEEEILHWAWYKYNELSWNGRQIQNAFQTALALAEWELRKKPVEKRKPTITVKHFETIGDATIQFDNYLLETYMGGDAAKLAKAKQLRADEFRTKPNAGVPDRNLEMPPRRPKPEHKRKGQKAANPESEASGSELSDPPEEEDEDDASSSEGAAAESEVDDKAGKKKAKKVGSKTKANGVGKAKVRSEAGDKGKTKDGGRKAAKGKKAKKNEDSDDSGDETAEEEEEEEVTDEEKAKKKKTKASSKKASSKSKVKRKQISEDEESDEADSDEENA